MYDDHISTTEIDDAFHTLMWSKHVIKTKHVVRLRCLYPHEPRMIWPNLTLPNTRRTKRHLFEVGKLSAKSFWSFCTSRDQHHNKSSSHDISCLFFSNSLDLRFISIQGSKKCNKRCHSEAFLGEESNYMVTAPFKLPLPSCDGPWPTSMGSIAICKNDKNEMKKSQPPTVSKLQTSDP